LLGPEYLRAIEQFDAYIGDTVDPQGAAFAASQTQRLRTSVYHDACYARPEDEEAVLQLENAKKSHFLGRDEDVRDFLRDEHQLFHPHMEVSVANDTYITTDSKWAWRTAAVYSAQYAGRQTEFRQSVQKVLKIPGRKDGFFGGVVSGTFWYPPRAVREWHTNKWDIDVGSDAPQYWWRMYYIRQKPAAPDGSGVSLDQQRTLSSDYFNDKSGMHLVEGPGIPPERLRELGAYPLNADDGVWRIPDQNGYVSLFRLQAEKPWRWHCIVADESVHRYSMGISFDDKGVEDMLRHVGLEL
jgi:hypothetical protein